MPPPSPEPVASPDRPVGPGVPGIQAIPGDPGIPGALPRLVWATAWVSFFTDMSTELIYAVLPVFYSTTLGLNAFWQGLIEGTAEAVASLTKLLSGYWSDRTGRPKWWMLAGYGLSTLSKPLIVLAPGGGTVLALRVSDRLGKGIRGAPRDAMIAQVVTPQQRGHAFGVQRALDHAGAWSGALLASAAIYFKWVSLNHLFWWTAVPGVIAVGLIAIFVHEPARDTASSSANQPLMPTRAWREQTPALKRYLAVLAVFALGNSTDALLLLRAQDQMRVGGAAPEAAVAALPLLWAWLHMIKSATSSYGGQLSDRVGRRAVVTAGWLIYALVYVGFACWNSSWAPWVLFSIYGVYYGLVEGPERALITDLTGQAGRRGTAFGLYYFIVGLAALPASMLCGALWQWQGPVAAFGTGAALALIAALLLPWALLTRPAAV